MSSIRTAIIASLIAGLIFIGMIVQEHHISPMGELIKELEVQQEYLLTNQTLEIQKQNLQQNLKYVTSQKQLKEAYYWLGYINFLLTDYEESNEYFFKALSIQQGSGTLETRIYMGISSDYYLLGDYEKSQEYYEKAQAVAIEQEDLSLLADVYQSRARLYINSISRLDTMSHLRQLSLYLDRTVERLIEVDLMMSEVCLLVGNFQAVRFYLEQAWMIALEQENKKLLPYTLYLGAIAYYSNGQYEEALTVLDELDSYSYRVDPMGMTYFLANSYYQLHGFNETMELLADYQQEKNESSNYWELIASDLLISEGNYEEARRILETVEVDGYSTIWKKMFDIKYKAYTNEELDLINEQEVLLQDSRQSLSPRISLYYISGLVGDQIVSTGASPLAEADAFASNQLSLSEPTFKDIQDIIDLKVTKDMWKDGIWVIIIAVGVTSFIGIMTYRLISIRKLKAELELKLEMDPLTETMNYEWLDREFTSLSHSHEIVQFLLIDIASFEQYNKAYGYLEGNKVLKQMGVMLKELFPNGWVIRYNGHQFLVVLFDGEQTSTDYKNQVCEAFNALNIPFVTDLNKGHLSVRVVDSSSSIKNQFKLDYYLQQLQMSLLDAKRKMNGNISN